MMLVSVMTRRYIYLGICWHDLELFVFEHSKGLGDHSGGKTSQGSQNELNLIGDLQRFQDSKIPRYRDIKISLPATPSCDAAFKGILVQVSMKNGVPSTA